MKKPRWMYVASGMNFIWRVANFTYESHPEMVKKMRSMVHNLDAKFDNHVFGVLFNGLTEQGIAERTRSVWDGFEIQVDSGGLQAITLGLNVDAALKDSVYKVQAKYGNIGFSFDKMPLKLVGTRSDKHDVQGRYFDPDILEDCATESGKDLARQIEVYLDEKTTCQPMMIVQGNNIEGYQQWAKFCLKQVPKAHQKYIAGVSSGAGALGQGLREDIERAFALSQLDVPDTMKKRFHILGVGSVNRLIPLIQFNKAGIFDKDVLFSYDSTKHTSGTIRGQYNIGTKQICLTRYRDEEFYNAYKTIGKVSSEIFGYDIDIEHFYLTVCQKAEEWEKKYGSPLYDTYNRNIAIFAFFLYSVYNAYHHIDMMETDDSYLASILKPKQYNVFRPLQEIKTREDYDYWKSHAARHVRSKKVKHFPSSVEEFFA